MLKFFRRIVKLATLAGVIGAAVAAYQQSRSSTPSPATSTPSGGSDTWPEVPRRPAE